MTRADQKERPAGPFHRWEPRLYLLVVGFAAVAALCVQSGVWWLRAATEERERELTEFVRMRAVAESAGPVDTTAPENKTGTSALTALTEQLDRQSWYRSVKGIEPRLEATAAGLRVALSPAPEAKAGAPR